MSVSTNMYIYTLKLFLSIFQLSLSVQPKYLSTSLKLLLIVPLIFVQLCTSFDRSQRLLYPSPGGTPLPPRDEYKRAKHRSNRYHSLPSRRRSKTYPGRLARLERQSPSRTQRAVYKRPPQYNSRSNSGIVLSYTTRSSPISYQ